MSKRITRKERILKLAKRRDLHFDEITQIIYGMQEDDVAFDTDFCLKLYNRRPDFAFHHPDIFRDFLFEVVGKGKEKKYENIFSSIITSCDLEQILFFFNSNNPKYENRTLLMLFMQKRLPFAELIFDKFNTAPEYLVKLLLNCDDKGKCTLEYFSKIEKIPEAINLYLKNHCFNDIFKQDYANEEEFLALVVKLLTIFDEVSTENLEFLRYIDQDISIVPEKFLKIVILCNGKDFITRLCHEIKAWEVKEIEKIIKHNEEVKEILLSNQGIHAGSGEEKPADIDGQCNKVITNLDKTYKEIDVKAEAGAIYDYINQLFEKCDNPKRKNELSNALKSYSFIREKYSTKKHSVEYVMALVWRAARDLPKLTGEYSLGQSLIEASINLKGAIVDALFDISRAYSGKDGFSCVQGSKNLLILALNKRYVGVDIKQGFLLLNGTEVINYEIMYYKFINKIVKYTPRNKKIKMFLDYDPDKPLVEQNSDWQKAFISVKKLFWENYKYSRSALIKILSNEAYIEINPLPMIKKTCGVDLIKYYLEFCFSLDLNKDGNCFTSPAKYYQDFLLYVNEKYSDLLFLKKVSSKKIIKHGFKFLVASKLADKAAMIFHEKFLKELSLREIFNFGYNFLDEKAPDDCFFTSFANYLSASCPVLAEYYESNHDNLYQDMSSAIKIYLDNDEKLLDLKNNLKTLITEDIGVAEHKLIIARAKIIKQVWGKEDSIVPFTLRFPCTEILKTARAEILKNPEEQDSKLFQAVQKVFRVIDGSIDPSEIPLCKADRSR